MDGGAACGEVEFPMLSRQFSGVGDAFCGLRDSWRFAPLQQRKRHRHRTGSFEPEPIVKLAASFIFADADLAYEQHVAGVEPFVHIHYGDSGRRVAGFDRGLDGRCAAPAREDGCVEIQTCDLPSIEYAFW